MFKLVFLTKRLIAPLILLAERSSRVWLISNQGVWTRLLPWPSFSFVNPRRPLDKRAFTPRHWCVSAGIPKGPVQPSALVLVVLGESFLKDLHAGQGCSYPREVQDFSTVSGTCFSWAQEPAHSATQCVC